MPLTVVAAFALCLAGRADAACSGDCGDDGQITIDELVTLVSIALDSAPLDTCRAGDAGGDGRITIDDLLRAVNAALDGCPVARCVEAPPDMVAWFPMDDGGGPEIANLVRSDHPARSHPAGLGFATAPQPVAGEVGGALRFDGAASFARVADSAALNFGRAAFSIDAWISLDPQAADGVRPIVDKRDSGGAAGGVRGYQLFVFNGQLGLQLADGANGNNTCAASGAACTNYLSPGPNLADGRPHHVAASVRRGDQPALTLYADGVAVLRATPRSGGLDNDADLLIARSELGGRQLAGWIDELELFDRALTDAEVAALFAAGRAGKCRPLDHFFCYDTSPASGSPPFTPIADLAVEDQFGRVRVDVAAPSALCAPASKNDEDAGAAAHDDHLRRYPVTARGGLTPLLPQQVVNQFGSLTLEVLAPSALLVPTAKNLSSTPPAPRPPAVDHFLCHDVQFPRGAPPFTPILGVQVEDQFGLRVVDLLAPTRLCAPADKRGEAPDAPRHGAHLLCYAAHLSPRVIQPPEGSEGPPEIVDEPFVPPLDPLYTNNQFGAATLTLTDVDELCVPSRKNPGDEPAEPLNCDDGNFCTEDRVVTYEPEADFEQPPPPTPGVTPEPEQGCTHDWKYGPDFGDWLTDREGTSIAPCCEADSDCDDGNPCTQDACAESEHKCYFAPVDPDLCGSMPIPPVQPVSPVPCVDDGLDDHLCTIQCIPGQFGEDCPAGIRPLELRPGAADVHHHLFDEQAFGGRWRNGSVAAPLHTCDGTGFTFPPHGRVDTLDPVIGDLLTCPQILGLIALVPDSLAAFALVSAYGPPVFSEFVSKIEGSKGDTGLHLKRRSPGSGWPRWDALVHQRGQRNTVLKAHQAGLNLLVVTVGGFAPFCELLPANAHGCDEMDDVDRQLALAHQFAAANASWAQIALSPQDAITIINSGKLAIVLAIETSDLFNTLFTDPNTPPDAAAIQAIVQKYYDPPYDVRSVQLAHETDNGFSGAALINPLFEVFQFADNRYGPSCHIDFDCARPRFGFDVFEGPDGVCRNALGLTPAGELLIQALMARGMLIDIAHMPEAAMLRTYQLAKQNVYYPLFHSHTKFRELEPEFGGNNHHVIEHSVPAWVAQKIRRSGGLIGLRIGYLEERDYTPSGVVNNCAGSSRSLAQAYEFGRQALKVPMAMGSDLNAFTQNTRPRFVDRSLPGRPRQNPGGACSAGFKAEGICQARVQAHPLGTGYDTRGLADTAYEIDVLRDLEHVGLSTSAVAPLRSQSAETFIRMWMRANDLPSPRNGPADLANDVDVSGVGVYYPKAARELNYPHANCFAGLITPAYCPKSAQLGDPCRFDGECAGSLICGSGPFCGLPESHCVCHGDGNGCAPGEYCKLRVPFIASDNVCRPQKDAGEKCWHRKECKSNQCKFTLNPFGPHCT
ncbi:MAG: LamG-like jellyroll fold domain-containing protein [Deltaproteobacteria bacterium]|nr:LamG-like jellyroll fold domain-containing protein [Deltaproteobacteria bacterium]